MGSVLQYKLMEKMEFLGLCTAVHTVWKIGGFFLGALGRAALSKILASASGARKNRGALVGSGAFQPSENNLQKYLKKLGPKLKKFLLIAPLAKSSRKAPKRAKIWQNIDEIFENKKIFNFSQKI